MTKKLPANAIEFVALRSDTAAVVALCERIAQTIGVAELDGLPITEWFQRQRLRELQLSLEELEDLDPAIAAQLQEQVVEMRDEMKRRGID